MTRLRAHSYRRQPNRREYDMTTYKVLIPVGKFNQDEELNAEETIAFGEAVVNRAQEYHEKNVKQLKKSSRNIFCMFLIPLPLALGVLTQAAAVPGEITVETATALLVVVVGLGATILIMNWLRHRKEILICQDEETRISESKSEPAEVLIHLGYLDQGRAG